MSYAQIPLDELELFKSLPDIKVVFDVGSRDDSDYVDIKPDIELHAFEPNYEFFAALKDKLGDRPNTYLNNFGLGDVEGEFLYNRSRQGFKGGEETSITDGELLSVRTLRDYIAEHKTEKIDFLKIDTEGYDFKVVLGAWEFLPNVHYLQYEYWNNKLQWHDLLEEKFIMSYVGHRNVFCTNKLWL